MELEEQRRDKGMLWQQTKESILEARGIISSTNSIACDGVRDRWEERSKYYCGVLMMFCVQVKMSDWELWTWRQRETD